MKTLLWIVLISAAANLVAETRYFLVSPMRPHPRYHETYVVGLSDVEDIKHARRLINEGHRRQIPTILVCEIAKGADGINRNYFAPDLPVWNWHVTRFVAFAENTIEILDAWPGYVASDVDSWIRITGGYIGFWSFTVSAELPIVPEIDRVELGAESLVLHAERLSVPLLARIQETDSLASGTWEPVRTLPITDTSMAIEIPRDPEQTRAFYRLEVIYPSQALNP